MMNRNVVGLIVVAVILLIGAGVFSWYTFLITKDKVVSGMSYYDKQITVKVNDQEIKVEPYGNFNTVINTDQPIKLVATNDKGETIVDTTYPVDRKAAIIVEILTPPNSEAQTGFCFISADVTEVYYVREGETVSEDYVGNIKNVQKLTTQPGSSLVHDLGYFDNISNRTVYPGRYSIDDLPDQIDGDLSVKGVFPVTCEALDKTEDLRDQVYVWRYFEEQGFNFGDLLEQ